MAKSLLARLAAHPVISAKGGGGVLLLSIALSVLAVACAGATPTPAPPVINPPPTATPVDWAAVACPAPGSGLGGPLRFSFYAFFEPVSYSADPDPDAVGYRTHLGYEADLLNALEAMAGPRLSFDRAPVGEWPGNWLLSGGPDFDVSGGGITILESRTRDDAGDDAVRFTNGHIAFRQSLLVRSDDAGRLDAHAALTDAVRVGVLSGTTGEARLLELTGLADAAGVLAAGTVITTPQGTLTADGTDAYVITAADATPNLEGRISLQPPSPDLPQVVFLGDEVGEAELLEALRNGDVDAVARGEIGNSDAASQSGGTFAVTALDPAVEYGGFTVAAAETALLDCLNDKLDYLTDDRAIGYPQWRNDPQVFMRRAREWTP